MAIGDSSDAGGVDVGDTKWFSSQHKADALYRGGTTTERVFDRSEHATTGRYQYLREKQCKMVLVFVILCCLVLREMMVFEDGVYGCGGY